ncbi:basic blue protein-like [Juglans microcarpa x Juglans regia]|uniref:basic blue protein-like n=1 Tax=Juglans microcarpa x Juglans regia TaxID=2249226 RepID=UPI001B7F3905|nr:basic blue protein-like [Juglans microcarpa x Juglans regia]
MEETRFFKLCSFLMVVLMIDIQFLKSATSDAYTVGDEGKWNDEADFVSWSQKSKFKVGDVLRFKYVKGKHNAYEVTEATYRSCDASSGVLAKYESGDDQVKLTQAKKYWFICNIPGHCLGGMRFGIDVKEASASDSGANTTNSAISTPPRQSSPPVSSCRSYDPVRWSMGIHLVAFGMLL